jgi:hypothetical protein
MWRSTDRRLTGLLTAALVTLAGCDGKSKDGVTGEVTATDARGPSGLAATSQTPRQAADAFLKDLGAGTVTPMRLTAAFTKKIARPFPKGSDGAREPGYSPPEVHEWLLRQFAGATFTVGQETILGDGIVVRGRATFPDTSTAFALRMVKDGKEYKADWLHRSDRQGSEIKSPADADLAAAQDVVRNFLDVLLGGDLKQARTLMSAAWRTRLSPASPADVRDGYDYGPGFLDGKLRSWRSDFLGYTLPTAELGSNKDAATFVAEMQAGGQNVPHTVKASKDKATGEWLVTDFDRK